MTKEKMQITSNKRMLGDWQRFKHLDRIYNRGHIEGDIFILTRIKDGQVIRKFNIHTFLPA